MQAGGAGKSDGYRVGHPEGNAGSSTGCTTCCALLRSREPRRFVVLPIGAPHRGERTKNILHLRFRRVHYHVSFHSASPRPAVAVVEDAGVQLPQVILRDQFLPCPLHRLQRTRRVVRPELLIHLMLDARDAAVDKGRDERKAIASHADQ